MFFELYIFSMIIVAGYLLGDWSWWTEDFETLGTTISITLVTLVIAPIVIGLILSDITRDIREVKSPKKTPD